MAQMINRELAGCGKVEDADSSPSSPRKRGCGRVGMTISKDLAARLEAEPFQNDRRSEFSRSLELQAVLEWSSWIHT